LPALVAVLLPLTAGAQSLADVARAEQARRKQQPAAGKVYTNTDLKRDHTAQTPGDALPPAPAAPETAAAEPTDPAAAVQDAPRQAGRDQAYWRGRITSAREQVERSQTFADALQTRINSLTADFVNRDDPAQRSVIEQNRLKAIAELERLQREIAAQTKAIADIEEEARKAGVPAGWLR
jgi:hypothetical protein